MKKNQLFAKKKNKDGSDYIDPETKDFVMELISEEEAPDEEEEAAEKISASDINVTDFTDEQLLLIKKRLEGLK